MPSKWLYGLSFASFCKPTSMQSHVDSKKDTEELLSELPELREREIG